MKNIILITATAAALLGSIISCTHVHAEGLNIPQAQEIIVDEPEEPV